MTGEEGVWEGEGVERVGEGVGVGDSGGVWGRVKQCTQRSV